MNKLEKLFKQAQSQEIENTQKTSSTFVRLSEDPRLIHFKPGNTYKFRLLFTEGPERKTPFINKFAHNFYDPGTKQLNWVVCPTSEYMSDRQGFRECPICDQTSKWYKEGENGSKTSSDLYKNFKRQFNGFVPVFVVNDPTNPDNNGTVKIMRYGILIKRFFKSKIFGINDKDNAVIEGADPIGIEAFKLEQGRDLIVTVTEKTVDFNGKKTVFPEYACEFSPRLSDVKITEKKAEQDVKDLKFDEDFYVKSTMEQRVNFFKEFVLKEDVLADNITDVSGSDELPKVELPTMSQSEPDDNVRDVTIQEADEVVFEPNKGKEQSNDILTEDDDIDDLLASIDAEY